MSPSCTCTLPIQGRNTEQNNTILAAPLCLNQHSWLYYVFHPQQSRYPSQLLIVDSVNQRNGARFSRQDDITISPPRMHTTRSNNSQWFTPELLQVSITSHSGCPGDWEFAIVRHESAHLAPSPTCRPVHLWLDASQPRVQYTDAAFL